MKTNRVTVELSDFAYSVMQRMIQEEGFRSESEVLEDVLRETHLQTQENAASSSCPWSPEEIDETLAEDDADPEGGYTLDQVREHFARKRGALVEAA